MGRGGRWVGPCVCVCVFASASVSVSVFVYVLVCYCVWLLALMFAFVRRFVCSHYVHTVIVREVGFWLSSRVLGGVVGI